MGNAHHESRAGPIKVGSATQRTAGARKGWRWALDVNTMSHMPPDKLTTDKGWRGDWLAIRSASPASGVARLTQDFEQDKSDASTALDLVAAHMWLREYEEAGRVCMASEAATPLHLSVSEYPVQIGAALWCLGRFDEARLAWWRASKAKYGDAAGANLHYLLLLFADSVLTGGDSTRIREELDNKRKDQRVHRSWPGPIGMFHLGIYAAAFVTDMAESRVSRWQFDFHRVVKTFGLRQQREAIMNELDVLLEKVESETDIDVFVDYARLPELHLARMIRRDSSFTFADGVRS